MNSILLTDHAAFVEHNKKIKEISSLLPYLNSPIKIGPNVIFNDVWQLIENDIDIYNTIFREALGHFSLKMYSEQFKKPSDAYANRDVDNGPDRLEAYFDIDLETWKGENTLSFIPSFHGMGPQKISDGDTVEFGGWSLTFTPINDYKGYPISLKETVNLYHRDMDNTSKSKEILSNVNIAWTVYDLLHAILDEVSWCGTPEEQMRKLAELEQTAQKVKDSL